eukprot:TRINITY_DN9142_c1_g3_i1.p2 TRINITY_DN9142_c1_g3~~TRINITY_DN9142_c1_g3_i1.p2  ORF type:complete len:186 (-),score=48.02 TRINITY_DN9142_c1_g3_i1:534-1091(-)
MKGRKGRRRKEEEEEEEGLKNESCSCQHKQHLMNQGTDQEFGNVEERGEGGDNQMKKESDAEKGLKIEMEEFMMEEGTETSPTPLCCGCIPCTPQVRKGYSLFGALMGFSAAPAFEHLGNVATMWMAVVVGSVALLLWVHQQWVHSIHHDAQTGVDVFERKAIGKKEYCMKEREREREREKKSCC